MTPNPEPTPSDDHSSDDHLRYLLTAYIFGDISQAGRAEVEAHLATCAECRAEHELLSETVGVVTKLVEKKSDDDPEYSFEERRRERVLGTQRVSRIRQWGVPIGLSAAAVVLLGLVLTVVTSLQSRSPSHRSLVESSATFDERRYSWGGDSTDDAAPTDGSFAADDPAPMANAAEWELAKKPRHAESKAPATEGVYAVDSMLGTDSESLSVAPVDRSVAAAFATPPTAAAASEDSFSESKADQYRFDESHVLEDREAPPAPEESEEDADFYGDTLAQDDRASTFQALEMSGGPQQRSERDLAGVQIRRNEALLRDRVAELEKSIQFESGGAVAGFDLDDGPVVVDELRSIDSIVGETRRALGGRRVVDKDARSNKRIGGAASVRRGLETRTRHSESAASERLQGEARKQGTAEFALSDRRRKLAVAPVQRPTPPGARLLRMTPQPTKAQPPRGSLAELQESTKAARESTGREFEVGRGRRVEGKKAGQGPDQQRSTFGAVAGDNGITIDTGRAAREDDTTIVLGAELRLDANQARFKETFSDATRPGGNAATFAGEQPLAGYNADGIELRDQLVPAPDPTLEGRPGPGEGGAGGVASTQDYKLADLYRRTPKLAAGPDSFGLEPERITPEARIAAGLAALPSPDNAVVDRAGRAAKRSLLAEQTREEERLRGLRYFREVHGGEQNRAQTRSRGAVPRSSTAAEFTSATLAVPEPEIGDEGLGRDGFRAKYHVNPFVDTRIDHLSTFAMDVDTAAFARARDLLFSGQMPAPDAVRVEAFVNAFREDLPADPEHDFSVYCEGGPSPFGADVDLLKVTVKARELVDGERLPAVLTLAVDTSGSMMLERRIDTVRQSLNLLIDALSPDDRVAIVAYGSEAYLALPHTPARDRDHILSVLHTLAPQGETNVEAGLDLAYRVADEAYAVRALNRVVLLSDGVATNGAREADELLDRVRLFADRGLYLSVVGFGRDRYNDAFLGTLAQEGNGNYAYVDGVEAAYDLFVRDLPGTLQVLAKDAKIQVDFDPAVVSHYRLLGYVNRDIKDEDFRNDSVDAGEVGPGSTVTALYEIQRRPGSHGSLGRVAIRYHATTLGRVEELGFPLRVGVIATTLYDVSDEFLLSASLAETAELLMHSYWARTGSFGRVQEVLATVAGDLRGHPTYAELSAMVQRARALQIEELSR